MNKYIRTCSNECCRIMEPAKPLTRLTEEVCQEARPRQVAVGVLLSCLCSAERAVASGSDGRLFRSGGRRPLFFDPPHHATSWLPIRSRSSLTGNRRRAVLRRKWQRLFAAPGWAPRQHSHSQSSLAQFPHGTCIPLSVIDVLWPDVCSVLRCCNCNMSRDHF